MPRPPAGPRELKDEWVHFRVRDIHHPDFLDVLDSLHGDDLLQGRVETRLIAAADRRSPLGEESEEEYVVVHVEGISQKLIVRSARTHAVRE